MNRSISDWGGNILAFMLVIVVNGMANGFPLGGQTTGEISASAYGAAAFNPNRGFARITVYKTKHFSA